LTGLARPLPPERVSDETPESLIPYDEIVQEALRTVVGRVLGEVERSGGLPGDHHFYITFKTRAPGVSIPKHLLERFPDEMTIVIQHRFWDLKVEEDSFTVGLSFGGAPAMMKETTRPGPAFCAPTEVRTKMPVPMTQPTPSKVS
jgi:hypothetical protein